MRMTTGGGLYAWEFHKDGQDLRVRVDSQLVFNTSYPMVDAAIAGYGIAYVPENRTPATDSRRLVSKFPRLLLVLSKPPSELASLQRYRRCPPATWRVKRGEGRAPTMIARALGRRR